MFLQKYFSSLKVQGLLFRKNTFRNLQLCGTVHGRHVHRLSHPHLGRSDHSVGRLHSEASIVCIYQIQLTAL